MKRILSVLLAVLMVFSTTVMAAPVSVSTVETVQEITDGTLASDAELNAVSTIKPGINMLTGTTEPLTGENTTNEALKALGVPNSDTTFTVSNDPLGEKGKTMAWYVPAGKGSYPSINFDFNGKLSALLGHNYIYYSFDYSKVVNGITDTNYSPNTNFWLMNSTTGAGDVIRSIGSSHNVGWKHFGELLDMTNDGTTGTKDPTSFKLEAEVRDTNAVPTTIYIDNFYAMPAYEFKFMTQDGTQVLDKQYVLFDEEGKVITSYKPTRGRYGNYYVPSWSTSIGGSAVESVALNNKNITLYATSMSPVITIAQEGRLGAKDDTAWLVPSVVSAYADELDVANGKWSIEDQEIATISTNRDGTAIVTAVAEGTTKATFTLGNIIADFDVKVAFPFEIDGEALMANPDGLPINLNPGAYEAMLIRLSGTEVGEEYTFAYQIDQSYGEFVVTATSEQSRDYYVDLTQLESWIDGESFVFAYFQDGNGTIESVKLYTGFDAGFSLNINAPSAYLSVPGAETEVSVTFKSQLEGTYDEGYTLSVSDPENVASYKIYEDGTALIRAKVGTGLVTVTATSNEDPEYSVSKEIYVNVDSSKYGHYHDFLGVTELDEAVFEECVDNKTGVGTHTVALGEDVLTLTKPDTTVSTGGLVVYGTAPGNQKYLVIKAGGDVTNAKIYYHYDNIGTAEEYTAYSGGTTNKDGTKTYTFDMSKVPSDAQQIKQFILQISNETSIDIVYMYTTSEVAEGTVGNQIAYTWDFTTNTFSAGKNQGLTVFNGETMKATRSYAVLDGTETTVQVDKKDTLADGTEIYRISTTNNGNHGSCDPKSYPSNILLEDYPYMWFTYRSNAATGARLYIMDKDAGGNESGWDSHDINFEKSEDWTTKVFYLPDSGYGASFNTVFTSIMFPLQCKTVLTDVEKDDIGYYVPVEGYKYSQHDWIEFDEITIANYNPLLSEEERIPLEMEILIESDSTTISEDSGSLTLSANVYANKSISTDAVSWSVDNGIVKLNENRDGTVTVTALSNGTVTVTATAVEDSSFKGSVTLTITGQRNKIAAYDFKYLALGNSYCNHGGTDQFAIWCSPSEPTRGMAASKPELDYYNRVQYYLANGLNGKIKAERIASSTTENASENETTAEAAKDKLVNEANFIRIKNYILKEQPNIITIQLSENFGGSGIIEETFYDVLYGMIDECRPSKSVVVVITPFGGGTRTNVIKKYAAKYHFYVADMAYIADYSKVDASKRYYTHPETGKVYDRGSAGWKYNPYLAWEPYAAYDDQLADGTGKYTVEFRSHPGDLGMEAIAQKVFEQLQNAVPSTLNAEYIYVPETIEISGENTITTLGGSVELTASVAPSDSATDVIWSVDNDKYAEIDENGVLTAKLNGTVTVTAKSAYDSKISATYTVTITGQPDVYTLTYDKGTDDEVENLPEVDYYAHGDYELSKVVPSRNGYKFLGWSAEIDGETSDTVNVTSDTTVYAVWALAEGWHFDEDGNDEGITLGGFNVVIENGIGTVLSYDEGVTISDASLLLKADNFDGFNVRMDLSGTDETDLELVLEITADGEKYTYSKDITAVGEQLLYSFDISDVEGTITGFALKPSAKKCQANVDWIEFERCSLSEDAKVDVVNVVDDYTVDADGNTFTVGTIIADDGDVITLKNGTFVIGEILGGTVVTDGNLVYDKDTLVGYVSVELAEKADEANVRYAEVDGVQFKIDGDTFGLVVDEAKLIQIVEKTDADAVTTVSSKYYMASETGITEITTLANGVDNVDEVTLRVKDPVGVRFKAGILNTAKADAVVKEYGFVIALERDLINAGADLTLDFEKIATGTAYISGTDTDVINGKNDTTTFFTGVLYGIPENSYGVKLVSKTFMKLDVDGKQYVVYGEPVTASAYRIAKTYENDETLSAEARAIIDNIIEKSENGNDLGFDFGDL